MASELMYRMFSASALVCVGVHHMVQCTRLHLKSPQAYSAKPFHANLPLYLLLAGLLLAAAHHCLDAASVTDPLVTGRRFTALQSASACLLFVLLAVSDSLLTLPSDLLFALAAAAFFLLSTVSSAGQVSPLQVKCDSLSGRVSALAALLSAALACNPRLFPADLGLGAAVCLQGLWALQTGLSLHVDAFVPEGCHRLLGAEGSTACDLEESALRADSVLDFAFSVHAIFAFLVVAVTYGFVSKCVRRSGSYEALPSTDHNHNHIQMKAISGTQA